jgi:hypothetical protein
MDHHVCRNIGMVNIFLPYSSMHESEQLSFTEKQLYLSFVASTLVIRTTNLR